MPKMKTHRGAAKRFRKTGSGRIRFKRAYLRHNLSSQQTSTKRKLRKPGYLDPVDQPAVDRLLRGD
ncbi:MAG: 50S ribosomal protein L35 [Myxococcales bacterium]|nr:50S ribosomal protein L35 [Myxococcales bacterium]